MVIDVPKIVSLVEERKKIKAKLLEQTITPEERWRYDGLNVLLRTSSVRYQPVWIYLTVSRVENDRVYYVCDYAPDKVKESSISRFLLTAEKVPEGSVEEQKPISFMESYLIEFRL